MELYRKVIIKSKDDLPKEYKFYVFGFKNGTVQGMNYYQNDKVDVLNNCDWYLQPIEQSEPVPVSAEIVMYAKDHYVDWHAFIDGFEFALHNPQFQSKPDIPMGEMSADYMQVRDLTDEEWLQLSKEEVIQLYKNCYEMLTQFTSQKAVPAGETKSAEEILKRIGYDNDSVTSTEKWIAEEIYNLALKDASQFTTQRQEIIDEDDFPKIQNTPEWNKEQSKGIGLREELILYHKWFEDEEVDEWAIHFVDKYLSKM